jgi:lipopolysaccharide transport system ATP-binding protein
MSDIAIRIEKLSKQYYIGGPQKKYTRLGEQVVDMVLSPFRRAVRLMEGQGTGAAELTKTFWALRDISLEIKHGDVVGIIGHNGAGKSTLLKILSRITEPTLGYADVFGRVSSLLEVGTGFHPELTGRENIYLNGAILGMRKAEIERKFDAIVDFAEIESFIDTPVKHYSSGMYVRLAFAVAAHLEPEILLVDEVLAVGDVAFQKKCLGKMDVISQQGRTVIFVTHNMNALQRLCPSSILLSRGQLMAQGATPEVVELYLSSSISEKTGPNDWINLSSQSREGTGKVKFSSISYSSQNQSAGFQPYTNGPLEISLDIVSNESRDVGSIAVTFYDRYSTKLVNVDTLALSKPIALREGHNFVRLRIEKLYLNPNLYNLGLWVADPPSEVYDSIPSAILLEVVELESEKVRVQADGLVPAVFEVLEVS